MKIISILFLIIFLISVDVAFAWTSYTHNWICERAGLDIKYPRIDCAAADRPQMQSKYPSASFVNHHCAYNATNCRARITADKFLSNNTLDTLGLAAHLYSDSLVPVHWYSTDYDTCHKIFEKKIEEKLRDAGNERYIILGSSFDTSSWNITMQCVTTDKTHQTVILYADDKYMESVAGYIAEKMNSTPVKEDVKEYNLDQLFYFLVILIIIVLVFFFYFGMKNRKRK